MAFFRDMFLKLLGRGPATSGRWTAANDNVAPKGRRTRWRKPKQPISVHVMGHRLPLTHVGRRGALEVWDLSDPRRLALLYLRHGRRLRLPSPKDIQEFGKNLPRASSAD